MHSDELDIDVGLVRGLLGGQCPRWADLPLERVRSAGTDNAIYRLGRAMAVRLPRRARTALTLEKEREWLPRLAPHLPLAVPAPLFNGAPAADSPWVWSVYRWLDGEDATNEGITDLREAATRLARFVDALQRIDATDGPPPGEHNFHRGVALEARDAEVRSSLARLQDEIDASAVIAAWEAALGAPNWQAPAVWIHGDLDARNLLVRHGSLTAVIDFGSVGVGDPACDVMVAWKVFSADTRTIFRAALSVDDATWARGRGWALSQAVAALAYYTPETNPVLVGEARRWLAEVLADQAASL